MTEPGRCQWWYACQRKATTSRIDRGRDVPICRRCADVVDAIPPPKPKPSRRPRAAA